MPPKGKMTAGAEIEAVQKNRAKQVVRCGAQDTWERVDLYSMASHDPKNNLSEVLNFR